MHAPELHVAVSAIFEELACGAAEGGGAFVLNSGDVGLLRSLDALSADDASHSVDGGRPLRPMHSTFATVWDS